MRVHACTIHLVCVCLTAGEDVFVSGPCEHCVSVPLSLSLSKLKVCLISIDAFPPRGFVVHPHPLTTVAEADPAVTL